MISKEYRAPRISLLLGLGFQVRGHTETCMSCETSETSAKRQELYATLYTLHYYQPLEHSTLSSSFGTNLCSATWQHRTSCRAQAVKVTEYAKPHPHPYPPSHIHHVVIHPPHPHRHSPAGCPQRPPTRRTPYPSFKPPILRQRPLGQGGNVSFPFPFPFPGPSHTC